jgi:hypothetical protein
METVCTKEHYIPRSSKEDKVKFAKAMIIIAEGTKLSSNLKSNIAPILKRLQEHEITFFDKCAVDHGYIIQRVTNVWKNQWKKTADEVIAQYSELVISVQPPKVATAVNEVVASEPCTAVEAVPTRVETEPRTEIVIKTTPRTHRIRGVEVMLDGDVAEFFGVDTKVLNQNAKVSQTWIAAREAGMENSLRFQLTEGEVEVTTRRSNNLTTSNDDPSKFSYALPWAYTRQGCYHFGTSLSSQQAYMLAFKLSELFAVVQGYAQARERVLTVGERHRDGILVVESYISIGKLLGARESLIRAEATHAVHRIYPDVNVKALLKDNKSDVQDLALTPTELGAIKGIDLSPQQVNLVLAQEGLQTRVGKVWALTTEGEPYGEYNNCAKGHSDGVTVKQLKWFLGMVKPFLLKESRKEVTDGDHNQKEHPTLGLIIERKKER